MHFTPEPRIEERYTQKQLLFELVRIARLILKAVSPAVESISITRTGDNVNPINPGSALKFLATLTPAVSPVAADVAWSSSDTTNAPVTVDPSDPTGLTADVNVPATAALVGFVLTCTYTNADGTTAAGTISETITAADVTAVSIARTA